MKKIITILICAIILVVAIFASTGFALFNINNTKIISNISIEGIEVGGLTKKEAEQKAAEEKERLKKQAEEEAKKKLQGIFKKP
jgi:uncharacterized protein HemX